MEKLFSASTDNSLTMLEREEAAFLHDSSSSRGKAAGAAAESDNAGERDSAFEARAYSLAAVRAGLPEARKQALMKEAESATSIAHLAVVVAKFEDRILTERLDPAFLLYVFCYTIVLPSFLVHDGLFVPLIHILLPSWIILYE